MSEQVRVCEWSGDPYSSTWETECDNAFVFNDEGPEENGFRFCPYCGGKMVVVIDVREGDGE